MLGFETVLTTPTLRDSLATTPNLDRESRIQRPNEREGAVSALNVAIEALNLAKEVSSITPAKVVCGTVSVILIMIKVGFLLVF